MTPRICALEMARKVSVSDDVLRTMMLRLEEIPFDSDRKLMSTKYELHGVPTILTKGAVDVLLDRTTHIRTSEGIGRLRRQTGRKLTVRIWNFPGMVCVFWHLLIKKWRTAMCCP